MPLPAEYEPAVRDPKKLNRTAWILLAIIVLGGWLILKAYEKVAVQKSADTRPSIAARILKERDLRIIRQDGKTADLFDLRGHVWAINVVDTKHPKSSELCLAVMKRLAGKYADEPDFNLVTLVVNPIPAGEAVDSLATYASAEGMRFPQWWVGTNEAATLHTFIKNELKTNVFPHEKNGEWIFDPTIVLVDRNGHIRRAVIPQKRGGPPFIATFDFDQAAEWDAAGKKTGTDRSNQAELEALLETTINTLLAEPTEKP